MCICMCCAWYVKDYMNDMNKICINVCTICITCKHANVNMDIS